MLEHLGRDELARVVTMGTLLFLGGLQIATPGCFWGLSLYFKGARAILSSTQRARLVSVIDARENAEGVTDAYWRSVGIFTLVMAILALIPAVPYVLPYALSCVAIAFAMLLSYLRFRRATERRVAPLIRRSPWTALPPLALIPTAICIIGAALFGAYPQFRAGSAIVVLSAIVLLAIAWRVAVAPAVLFGDDSQLEYLVDEHVRFCRATGLLSLACAPPTVLVGLAWATLPPNSHFFTAIALVVYAAFVGVMLVSLNPLRKHIEFA